MFTAFPPPFIDLSAAFHRPFRCLSSTFPLPFIASRHQYHRPLAANITDVSPRRSIEPCPVLMQATIKPSRVLMPDHLSGMKVDTLKVDFPYDRFGLVSAWPRAAWRISASVRSPPWGQWPVALPFCCVRPSVLRPPPKRWRLTQILLRPPSSVLILPPSSSLLPPSLSLCSGGSFRHLPCPPRHLNTGRPPPGFVCRSGRRAGPRSTGSTLNAFTARCAAYRWDPAAATDRLQLVTRRRPRRRPICRRRHCRLQLLTRRRPRRRPVCRRPAAPLPLTVAADRSHRSAAVADGPRAWGGAGAGKALPFSCGSTAAKRCRSVAAPLRFLL